MKSIYWLDFPDIMNQFYKMNSLKQYTEEYDTELDNSVIKIESDTNETSYYDISINVCCLIFML